MKRTTRHHGTALRSLRCGLALACSTFSLLVAAMALAETEDADIHLWPVLVLDGENTTILYPLYSKEGDSITAFPFYYRTHGGDDHHILWPLVKVSDGRLVRAAPIYFAREEGEYTFFPFIHRGQGYTATLIPPMYVEDDKEVLAVLPFYIRAPSRAFYFPSIYTEHHIDEAGEPTSSRLVVFPLFSYEQDTAQQQKKLRALFVASADWGQELDRLHLLPLGAYNRKGRCLWVGPYYGNPDETLVFPFYYEKESGETRERWILSYHSSKTATGRTDAVYPFFRTNAQALPDGRSRHGIMALWPLYDQEVVQSADGRRVSSKNRFLFFEDERMENGTRRFSFFGLPLREVVEPGTPPPALETAHMAQPAQGASPQIF